MPQDNTADDHTIALPMHPVTVPARLLIQLAAYTEMHANAVAMLGGNQELAEGAQAAAAEAVAVVEAATPQTVSQAAE